MRVLIVDDSAFMRRAITKILERDPSIKVVATARDGEEGVARAFELRPDAITLDVEMPVLDGIGALRRLRADATGYRPAIIMCSSLTTQGSHEALRALRLGADDVVAKPGSQISLDIDSIADELIAKIKAIGTSRAAPIPAAAAAAPPTLALRGDVHLVAIGSSTGGPPALEKLLERVPGDFPAPIVVAQHMPLLFTRSLAERLDQVCRIGVAHGENAMALEPGVAYVCPGGSQSRVVSPRPGRLALEVTPPSPGQLYKPSVNALFQSVAQAVGARGVGVVLTGMGDDGAIGAIDLRQAGAPVLAQERESCVVFGMPRAVVERGLASASMTPEQAGDLLAAIRTPLATRERGGARSA